MSDDRDREDVTEFIDISRHVLETVERRPGTVHHVVTDQYEFDKAIVRLTERLAMATEPRDETDTDR